MLFFKQNPFVRYFAIAFIGIFAAANTSLSRFEIAVCYGILFLLVVAYSVLVLNRSLFSAYRHRWLPGVIMIPALMLLFATYYYLRQTPVVRTQGNFKLYGIVDDVLTTKDNSAQYIVDVSYLENDSCRIDGPMKVLVYVKIKPDSIDNLIGQRIEGSGFLTELQNTKFPYQFDYGKYLQQNGYSCQFFLNNFSVGTQLRQAGFWDEPFLWLRQHFRNRFAIALNDRSIQGVVQALIIGDRSQLDASIRDAYVKAGAIHILAVSGMHVGILYLALAWLFSFMRHRKIAYTVCCLFVLWFYAGLTGNPPSVLRATIMFSVILIGEQSSRNTSIYNLLAFSGFVIAIINPNHLFNAGFWLSHLAVLGIGMFYKRIDAIFSFRFMLFRWIWSVVAVSLAAQIFTLPMMMLLFNGFSVYFLLSNILVLPLISVILLVALLLAIVPSGSFFFQMLAGVEADMVRFINDCVVWVASLPGAYLDSLSLSFFEVLVYFIVVLSIVLATERRRVTYYWTAFSASIILFLSISLRLYAASSNYSLFALGHPKNGFVNLNCGRNSFVFTAGPKGASNATFNLLGAWGRNFSKPIMVMPTDSFSGGHMRVDAGSVDAYVFAEMDDFLEQPISFCDNHRYLRLCLEPGKEMVCIWDSAANTARLYVWGKYITDHKSSAVFEKYVASGCEIALLGDGYCSLPQIGFEY